MLKPLEQVNRLTELMTQLQDIRKRPAKYALSDLNDWMEKELEEACYLLDDLRYELDDEYGREVKVAEGQLILNAEHKAAIEEVTV